MIRFNLQTFGYQLSTSDLTGYTWVGNNTISQIDTSYSIDFTSNNETYNDLGPIAPGQANVKLSYVSTSIDSAYLDGWVNQEYKTIKITGGQDATNPNLIMWLEDNGTLTPTPIEEPSTPKLVSKENLQAYTTRVKEFVGSNYVEKNEPIEFSGLDDESFNAINFNGENEPGVFNWSAHITATTNDETDPFARITFNSDYRSVSLNVPNDENTADNKIRVGPSNIILEANGISNILLDSPFTMMSCDDTDYSETTYVLGTVNTPVGSYYDLEPGAHTGSMTESGLEYVAPTADTHITPKKYVDDSLGGLKIVKLTQSEYDSLSTKDSSTLYIISE